MFLSSLCGGGGPGVESYDSVDLDFLRRRPSFGNFLLLCFCIIFKASSTLDISKEDVFRFLLPFDSFVYRLLLRGRELLHEVDVDIFCDNRERSEACERVCVL